jgi:hypothetical protein
MCACVCVCVLITTDNSSIIYFKYKQRQMEIKIYLERNVYFVGWKYRHEEDNNWEWKEALS